MIPVVQPITPFLEEPPRLFHTGNALSRKTRLPSEVYFSKFPTIPYSLLKREELLKYIQCFLRLPENWDGYGASSLDGAVYDSAVKILRALPVPLMLKLEEEKIVPSPNGTIEMEWHWKNYVACLDVGRDSASAYMELPKDHIRLEPGPVNTSFLKSFFGSLEKFYSFP